MQSMFRCLEGKMINLIKDQYQVSTLKPFLVFSPLLILFDQLLKQVMLSFVFDPPRYVTITSFLNLVPVWNPGMSFGFLSDGGSLVRFSLTALAFGVSGWLVLISPRLSRIQRLSAALIAGGAIGNAIDRLRFGKVIDFIDFHFGGWHWPAFNIADTAITIGAIIWAYSIVFEHEKN